MKLLKNIFFSAVTIIVVMCTSMHAAPNFELLNKSKKPIQLTLSSALIGKPESEKIVTIDIAPGKHWDYSTQEKSKITMKITDGTNPIEASIYAPNKTTYLTYNPGKTPSLYPQTGPLMGMAGNTESGLPLKNNIKASDISQK